MNLRARLRRAALVYDEVVRPAPGLTVLAYHRVGGGSDSSVDLPVATFREQMELVAATRQVWSLGDAVAALAAGRRPTGVVITFDDGAADFCHTAAPVMAALGLPSTLYVVTASVDSGTLPWGVEAASWTALRDAVSTGLVTIESHTHTHRLQHRVSDVAAAEELDRSIERIATEIGRPPSHFAYPKAVRGNAVARAAVASRFRSAALAGNRTNRRSSDLHRLGRTPVSRGDDITLFAHLCDGGLRVEGIVRDVRGRRRYRKATT